MTGTPAPSTIEFLHQYVRDLSFEHPTAPHSLTSTEKVESSADIEVTYRQLDGVTFESSLKITARAKTGDTVIAVVELLYGGLYRLPGFPPEVRESFLMLDAPRDLFPFARALIVMVTQAAGIPPIVVSAPNFQETYRRMGEQRIREQQMSEQKAV
jgi:preprotein translocase subunit SecB